MFVYKGIQTGRVFVNVHFAVCFLRDLLRGVSFLCISTRSFAVFCNALVIFVVFLLLKRERGVVECAFALSCSSVVFGLWTVY